MDPKRVYDAWGPAAEAALLAILRGGVYVKGPHVAAFEQALAALVGVKHAVAVDSGTEALTLVLRAVLSERPPEQREVILPTFTFVATAGSVVNAGGRPVFADVDRETMNLCPLSVRERLGPRTAAVVPVHLFGAPADMDGLAQVLEGRRDVFVLEDAAQAIHATWRGRRAGSLAGAAAFSFYPSKNLGAAGDAGAVTTDDAGLADAVASLRDHGQRKKLYSHERVGTNARMDEMQAAVLATKLPHVPAWTAARRALARRYDEAFRGTAVVPQRIVDGAESAYHLYTVRLPQRDVVKAALEAAGIGSGIYYPVPLHRQACFASAGSAACPTADALALEVLSLPLFPGLTVAEQEHVIATVLTAVGTSPRRP
jgi:dTDP-4-amino-4,6-dideoxygalactose transaminase